MTPSFSTTTPSSDARVDNGILARVPGAFIGAASNSLPAAESAAEDVMRVEVDAGWLGRVRLTFEKYKFRRSKGHFSSVSWSCKHAELVAAPDQGGTQAGGALED